MDVAAVVMYKFLKMRKYDQNIIRTSLHVLSFQCWGCYRMRPRSIKPVRAVVSISILLFILAFLVAAVIFYLSHAGALPDGSPNKLAASLPQVSAPPLASSTRTSDAPSPILIKSEDPSTTAVTEPLQHVTTWSGHQNPDTVAHDVVVQLQNHPLHRLEAEQQKTMSLEDHFVFLSKESVCADIPIFTSMASVFSDMYWQM